MIDNFRIFNERNEEKDETSFVDLMKKYFIKDGKYQPYISESRQLIDDVLYWPSGIDPENFELVHISEDEATVYSGGDWQEGMYITIAPANSEYHDEPKIEVVEAINASRGKDKVKKMKVNDRKKWFKKYLPE